MTNSISASLSRTCHLFLLRMMFAAVHRTPGHEDHEYFETNIRGAENVVAFAEKWNIKKIVFTSSIAPYGAAEELKKETTLPTPNTA